MNNKEAYEWIVKKAKDSPYILGLLWGGSRGKDEKFLTDHSDYDLIIVFSDDAPEELKKELNDFNSDKLEVFPKTLKEFREHAQWGTESAWDRYNYAHNKAIIDKTGEIQEIINEKGNLPQEVQESFLEGAMDSYINLVYRSAKYWRDGNEFAALLDAGESLPYLMDVLYALEGRIKPYNKYFEWELRNYPLIFLPFSVDEFISDYKTILTTGDIDIQKKIFSKIKELFIEKGHSKSIQQWKGKYFVG